MKSLLTVLMVLFCACAQAATYYVKTNGNNALSGLSIANAWSNINYAATVVVAGDTVRVQPGLYSETITEATSGTAANPITYLSDGVNYAAHIDGSFYLNGANFVRIIGFEFTQITIILGNPALRMLDANFCQILDCYIHDTYGNGVQNYGIRMGTPTAANPCHTNVIRGNVIMWIGSGGYSRPAVGGGACGIQISGNANVIEYNRIAHVADYSNAWGSNNVVRNNWFDSVAMNEFTGSGIPGDYHHIDGLQYFATAGAIPPPIYRLVMECNWMQDAMVEQSHFLILRDIYLDGAQHATVRRNVLYNNGGDAIIFDPMRGTYVFNNTMADLKKIYPGNAAIGYVDTGGVGGCTNFHLFNNIFTNVCNPVSGTIYTMSVNSTQGRWTDWNLRWLTGDPTVAEPNGIEDNPDFVSTPPYITNTSPAIHAAVALSAANGAGVGSTSLTLRSNVQYFYDGFGVVDGDWIVVGTAAPVQITALNEATSVATLSAARSWSDNDLVWLATPGYKMDDIGALPYLSTGYSMRGTNFVVNGTNYTVTVRDTNLVRFVVFYDNGVPQTPNYTPPYTYTGSSNSWAKMFSRFPSTEMYLNAENEATTTSKINIGGSVIMSGNMIFQ